VRQEAFVQEFAVDMSRTWTLHDVREPLIRDANFAAKTAGVVLQCDS
jgi:hypothetical protein